MKTLIGFDAGGAFTCVAALQQLPVKAARGPISISRLSLLITSDRGRNLVHLFFAGPAQHGWCPQAETHTEALSFFKKRWTAAKREQRQRLKSIWGALNILCRGLE